MPRLDTTYDLRPGDVIRFMTITTSSAGWTVLPTLRQAIGVMLRNPSTNTINIAISHTNTPAAGDQIVLAPGQALSFDINNPNLLYHKAASGSPTLEVIVVLSSRAGG